MSTEPTSGPDFLCVGMQKAGTQWLYDQMAACTGVWMPPIKELNFWAGQFAKPSNLKTLARMQDVDREDFGALRPETVPFQTYLQGLGPEGPRNLNDYRGLFRFKGDRISGDISPVYATMSAAETAEVARALPTARVVLLVRHPVDRLKSALSMHVRKKKIPESLLSDWQGLRAHVSRSSYRLRSHPTRSWAAWQGAFGPRARVWLFDDIVSEPDRVRHEIAAHLCLTDPQFARPANFNRKASKQKYSFSPEVEEGLFTLLGDEIRACAQVFGGAATAWRTSPQTA